MQYLKQSLLILVLLVASAMASAEQTQPKTIFYNITTDEAWPAGMAIGQATKAMKVGYKSVIFLNVRGVFIAHKTYSSDSWAGSDKNLQDMLKHAIKSGAQVIICPQCMKKVGMTMENVIDGVVKGGPDVTLKAMTADNTSVISF